MAQTPFSNAIVKLQSGGDIPLLEVPWFKNQVMMWSGKHSFYSNDYFIVFSSPNKCPSSMSFSYAYPSERGGSKNPREFLKSDNKFGEVPILKECNDYLLKQINDLPGEIKEKCKCSKVLQTTKHANSKNDDSIWESLDDNVLFNHELIFRFNINSKTTKEPIFFSIGTNNAGIYDIYGNKLCAYDIPFKLEFNLNYLRKIKEKTYSIYCVNKMKGQIDLSNLAFSFISSDLIGEINIKFENGEQYDLKK